MTAEEAARPPIVVRDNRRVDAGGSTPKATRDAAGKPAASEAKPAGSAKPDERAEAQKGAPETAGDADVVEMTITPTEGQPDKSGAAPEAESPKDMEDVQPMQEAAEAKSDSDVEGGHVFAELSALRSNLDELTRDLQRVTAEYANYRKRVDRDRTAVQEQAAGNVLMALLPVLDDLDRARNHGDLVGPFAAVADQLTGALSKFGLTAFGETGDAFDPQLHEAVSHTSSPDVTETTCVEIMRRGYLLGERLLRPALVGVADPE